MKFNSDLYVVAATVIPVLFIAVTLQASFFTTLALSAASIWYSSLNRDWFRPTKHSARIARAASVLRTMAFLVFGLVLVAGSYGGWTAIKVLEQGHATTSQHRVVMSSLAVLAFAPAVLALVGYLRGRREVSRAGQMEFSAFLEERRNAGQSEE
jgi:hypothetical protein